MIRSFTALQHIDPGFDPRNVVTMSVSVDGNEQGRLERACRVLRGGALARSCASRRASRRAASITCRSPATSGAFRSTIEGRPKPEPGEAPNATYRVVFPGYFHTMRIPILRGRDDQRRRPRRRAARRRDQRLHGEDALARRERRSASASRSTDRDWITVVGVAKNTVREQWSAPPEEEMFLPYAQERDYQTIASIASRLSHARRARVVRRAAKSAMRRRRRWPRRSSPRFARSIASFRSPPCRR